MKKTKLLIALCLAGSAGFAQFNNVVSIGGTGRFAGTGQPMGLGEPQPNNLGIATTAPPAIKNDIGGVTGVAVDHAGNVFYIDVSNDCIMKINHGSGTANLIAGVPSVYGGYYDDGIAGHAIFSGANSLCLDAAGNLYISDSRNYVIRMIIPTVAGAINASCSIITVAGTANTSCSGTCSGSGPATSALLADPQGIAVDQAGSLYIADNWSIKKVTNASTPASSIINTLLGSAANALTLDPANGDLYFGSGRTVYKVAAVGGLIPTSPTASLFAGSASAVALGDGGPATSANLTVMYGGGLAVDASHNVYIGDNGNLRIRKVNSTGTINTVAGTGATSSGAFYYAAPAGNNTPTSTNVQTWGLATDACGSVYFSDLGCEVIGKLANPVTFAPTISVPTASVCSGAVINATANSGSNVSTIYPDSYIWSLISANSSWAPDGFGVVANGSVANPGSNSISLPIATTGLNCNHNYILQVTATKNCPVLSAATSTVHVTINCNPAPVITGNTTICSGSSTTLCENLSGFPYTINWTHGHGLSVGSTSCVTVNPTTNTTYNVGITNISTGCYGSASQLVTVVTNNPSFSLSETPMGSYFAFDAVANMVPISIPSGYAEQYTVTELTGPTGTVIWTSPSPSYWNVYPSDTYFDGFDNHTVDYSPGFTLPGSSSTPGEFAGNTTYVVSHTSWNNTCTVPASLSYTVTLGAPTLRIGKPVSVTGISNSTDLSSQASIYPNPSTGNFTIETSSVSKQTLQVFDINGRIVLSQTINGKATVNAGDLIEGVYNVNITSDDGVINKRLVIVK